MPRVSVIVAAYNCAEEIGVCIDSILQQTFKDFELIICDDASTDSTWEKLIFYKQRDSRIKILRNNTNSLSAKTRNRCLELAQGEYIAIQDADDYSAKTRLEEQVRFLDVNLEYDFVGTSISLFDDTGIWSNVRKRSCPTSRDMLFSIPFAHASLLLKKEAINRVKGYRVAKETRRAEDYDLVMRLYASGSKGFNLSESLYFYRVDQRTLDRRLYKYRIEEAIVRYKGFKEMGLLPLGAPYVIKPLVVGLIPISILQFMKGQKRQIKN